MAKPKLTPEQLEEKKARDNLTSTINRVKSKFSFGEIKTFYDLQRSLGFDDKYIRGTFFPTELDRKLTFPEVKDILSDKQIELDTFYWLKRNPPITELTAEELAINNPALPTEIVTKDIELLPAVHKLEEHDSDYGLEPSPKEKAFLFWFQKKAVKDILDSILVAKKRGRLLVAGTGTGKTFIAGALFRRLLDRNFHLGKTFTPWPYVYVTKASVVEQTKRVFRDYFNINPETDVLVINIDQLRSKFGERFVNEECKIIQGEEVVKWFWRDQLYPIFILWDECQALKNEGSQQSKIAQSYNEIESENTFQVFMSATPGTKVAEMKCFCVSTRVPYTYGLARNAPLTNDHFNDFAKNIASDFGRLDISPEEHSPSAMARLMDKMDPYITRVKGVKSQFHAINTVQMISFETQEGREFYNTAWDRFQEKKAKLEGSEFLSAAQSRFQILAQLTIFRIAAESNPDRVRWLARAMWESVQKGQAACAALNFKIPITKIVNVLINDYNVSRDDISIIWGGAAKPNKKQKLKAELEKDDNASILDSFGISMEDIDLDEIEAAEEEKLDPSFRLGAQSQKERQREIDRFQSGKSKYCFYTFRAGGVGLSFHHCDEQTKEKVRHKESGYAFEEDIAKIPTRQRVCYVAPTYSAIELVQGLGRCPRLTSLSDTPQLLIFFRGTVEERVAAIVSMKLRCLTKVVRQHESWETIIVGRDPEAEQEKHMRTPSDNVMAGELENGEATATEGMLDEDEED